MIEEWKQVIYRGILRPYEVSNTGRVRRIAGPDCAGRMRPATEIRQFETGDGYLQVQLCHEKKRMYPQAHALVALAFLPPHPWMKYGRGKLAVNHKDGNKKNNNLPNLEWSTYLQNKAHAVVNGLVARGAKCHFTKLNEDQVREIRRRWRAGESKRSLAGEFGVSDTNVVNICRRKTWRHVK